MRASVIPKLRKIVFLNENKKVKKSVANLQKIRPKFRNQPDLKSWLTFPMFKIEKKPKTLKVAEYKNVGCRNQFGEKSGLNKNL